MALSPLCTRKLTYHEPRLQLEWQMLRPLKEHTTQHLQHKCEDIIRVISQAYRLDVAGLPRIDIICLLNQILDKGEQEQIMAAEEVGHL